MKSNAAELTTIVDYAVLDTRLNSHRHEVPAPIRLTEHYSLRGEVGAGGVGRVLLGFDERIGREVAIKEMHADAEPMDPRIHARFVREAQITGRLEHLGIVPVYDLGATSKGSPFYVMRLVRGDTLSKALAARTAGRPEAALAKRLQLLGSFIDICEAMAYAHSRGVVRRDLKPGNVVLGAFGETILLDWGLAKIAAEADTAAAGTVRITEERPADLTRQGAIMGTPAYMAPEQLDPAFGDIDPRTGVFALSCILYQILVGSARLGSPEPMPLRAAPAPPELVAICDKAMRKDQAVRYRDAGELAAELRAYRDGRLVSTYAYSRAELLRRSVARNKMAVIAGVVAITAVLVGAGLAVDFGRDAHRARRAAEAAEGSAVAVRARADSALANITRIADHNLLQAGTVARTLSAALAKSPAETGLSPRFFADLVRPDSHAEAPTTVWILDSDGRLVHGPDASEIGRNFFRDERYTAVPTLRRLAKEVRYQDAGIGFYEYPATNGDVSYHIATWQAAHIATWQAAESEDGRPWEGRGGRGLEVALALPKTARRYRGLSDSRFG
ncbi:MAG: serine/threonine protein kinase [Pseudomonadota bacterium]|nr:serine/threonine protein kinase [Pseudomonadota bacterium]